MAHPVAAATKAAAFLALFEPRLTSLQSRSNIGGDGNIAFYI
nr:MAG TPA: hypothetical protein [Caudoviricetes sp.]